MKSRILTCIAGLTLFAVVVLPTQLAAQQIRYKLVDMGTFGGPASYLTNPGNGPGFLVLNDAGVLVGRSETTVFNPTIGFLAHAFRWEKGVLSDLGTPAGAVFSQANGVNARGWVAIDYSAGEVDPLNGGTISLGALWRGGQFFDVGTLGGLETDVLYVNNAGQVVGFSTINTTPHPFSFLGAPTHPFIWQDGVIRDLGTLGGPDAGVAQNCDNPRSNLVTGTSFIDSNANPDTGLPTSHPYLWENGEMKDLGTLGGTIQGNDVGAGEQCVNNAGQVAGTSFLAGNSISRAFLWEHGVMRDLGTLGGDNSQTTWLNDAGDVVGEADLPGAEVTGIHHAFLWRNGTMMDLGTLGPSTSLAVAVNPKGQVVGRYRVGAADNPLQHAFIWENGGPMIDLNTLVPPNSPLELFDGENINDRGEIAGRGFPPGCDDANACPHAFLLIPCDPAAGQDCSPVIATQANAALPRKQKVPTALKHLTAMQRQAAWRAQLTKRIRFDNSREP
jgi:probable HAF family extracellular repeat protein